MSQDLRDYDLYSVDENDSEATRMGVTATVGPTGHGEIEDTRGVQFTLETPNGVTYARVSEPQVRDLIELLKTRVDPDDVGEATRGRVTRTIVKPDGEIHE